VFDLARQAACIVLLFLFELFLFLLLFLSLSCDGVLEDRGILSREQRSSDTACDCDSAAMLYTY
jgi:hypothetical protein